MKSVVTKTAAYLGILTWICYVLFVETQPVAQPTLDTFAQVKKEKIKLSLAEAAEPAKILDAAMPAIDSAAKVKRKTQQDALDKATTGNLYMQKKMDAGIASGLAYQQLMFAKVDRLQRALDDANMKLAAQPDTVYLTPLILQTDTVYRGLVPIPQSSNRDRKALEKAKQGVEQYYRDSSRPGGRSQIIVGYRTS